jgi:hypothetical protein
VERTSSASAKGYELEHCKIAVSLPEPASNAEHADAGNTKMIHVMPTMSTVQHTSKQITI